MRWNGSGLCAALGLFVLCLADAGPCQTDPKHRRDRTGRIRQKTHGTGRVCDPSPGSQATGSVAEACGTGFYRERRGTHRGQCVPCSCNKLSEECDEQTGHCVNCRFNTTGDRCERCKEGFYGNAAERTCRACPCPFTWNSFALACLDVGAGEVECLCRRGYAGARCERCARGYYGNTAVPGGGCEPCSCGEGAAGDCDALTGACMAAAGSSSCGGHCRGCDGCSAASLANAEEPDDGLASLQRRLQNPGQGSGSLLRLNRLNADTAAVKSAVGRHSAAVKHLGPNVEQLETDTHGARYDVNRLMDETVQTASDVEKVLRRAKGTKLRAGDVVSAADSLYTAGQGLMKQLSGLRPSDSTAPSENDGVRTMEAQHLMQEMRGRGCSAQRDAAGSEHEQARGLFRSIRSNVSSEEVARAALNQAARSLMRSDSSLNKAAELLSAAEATVNRAKGRNRDAISLQHLQTQLGAEQSGLLPVMEMTRDVLREITNTFSALREITKECEAHAAQLDGAKRELVKALNELARATASAGAVGEAGEHAERLKGGAAERAFPSGTNATDLLRVLRIGVYDFINDVEKVELAANESRLAADQASKEVEDGGLTSRAEGLGDSSAQLKAGAIERDLKRLSRAANAYRSRVNKQRKKSRSLRAGLSAAREVMRSGAGDVKVAIEAAKTAASASNATVDGITERLKVISQEVGRITLPNMVIVVDARETLKRLKGALPGLKDKLTHVAALSRMAPPTANVTQSIWNIKDVIEETRTVVNRLSVATFFNGTNHVELRLPRSVEDLKAFTAFDLLLNRHQSKQAERGRTRRRDAGADMFVLYLGDKDASGDYAGMAVRNNALVCVYKLGGVVHEMKADHVTAAAHVNSSHFDRVVFRRLYQDAEVHVTYDITSPKLHTLHGQNFPDTKAGVHDLRPDSVVFYVGGYPQDFTPPVELHYPGYRGAIKLSYINDSPVCLLNYKRAVGVDAKQPFIRVHQSEVSDYYDGTGYRMAYLKEPKTESRLFTFHTNSRETNALLFYIGNEESVFCVFVENGFLVLQGRQAGQELRAQSDESVSLFDQRFAIQITERFVVQYAVGSTARRISTDHVPTAYERYFIGGLPAELRHRHDITAPPLRGCVDHLTADSGSVHQYNRTTGVTGGCPLSMLGVRAATLSSARSADPLFAWEHTPVSVSMGFRTTGGSGVLVRSSSQGSDSAHDLQLSLADGYVLLNSGNYTLKSDKRYNDGSWHYLSAVRRPTGLELSVDNVNAALGPSLQSAAADTNSPGENFTACVADLYSGIMNKNFEQSLLPVDLASLSLGGGAVLGSCRLRPLVAAPAAKPPRGHGPVRKSNPSSSSAVVVPRAPAGGQCRGGAAHDEHHLYDEHSWLRYSLPPEELNHRPHFSFDFKTKSPKGLILHVAGKGAVPLLAVYIANGRIKMSLGLNRVIQHNHRSSDDSWHRVELSVERSAFHLLVDGLRVTDGQLSNGEGSLLELNNPVYLGGGPDSTLKKHNVPTNSVIGCIRNFRMNDVAVGAPESSHRVLPCVQWHQGTGTYFGGGHIVLDNHFSVGSDFALAFELRPQHLTGLLLHFRSNKTSLNVFLMENTVGVKVSDGNGAVSVSVRPHQSLCDERFHTVTVSRQGEVIKLEVDSLSEQKAGLSTSLRSSPRDSLHVGGTAKYSRAPVSSPFLGCLRNLEINRRPVAFEAESRVFGPVSINTCPVY
ncbi:laminin subunit alpha-3 isoform X2 [Betta splendens]|uniref:Laminin subunit alpha-3 isoform X2 n=1 Tax=Betta splendens TaxID=158456 RepID=A0A9W2XQV1_BETSP|nr:laminin subunit alpha-3 isoform X2 [Betta splendens]